MSFDAERHRRDSHEAWEEAASGWRRNRETISRFAEPVSRRLLETLDLQPGQRVLELAAGIGELGAQAAARVAPGGSVVISDQAESMLEGARELAAELGAENVEFRELNAEWIDFPLASFDAVVCRWGYMLMADPAAALAESRRVLKPGGRIAFAVWDALAANPWAALPGDELRERGLVPVPAAGWQPGPFALGDAARVRELLGDAGFTGISIEPVEMVRRHASFAEFWQSTLDLSRITHEAVMSRPAAEGEEIAAAVASRLAPFTAPDGSLEIPARTLCAGAEA